MLKVTGLRNPCVQLDLHQKGLTKAVLDHDADRNLVRKAGIMAVVVKGGMVYLNDLIVIKLLNKPFEKLEKV